MGALHNGHLHLVEKSKFESDISFVSIFINPTQFTNSEDLENYPKSLDKDLGYLESAKVDYVFVPDYKEIYPEKTFLKFDFDRLGSSLEGVYRPGHFNGVGIIVSKLLHIVHPNHLYLGQKDLQQVAVIKRLVQDLSFDLKIIVVPTHREEDGLAMSSRNTLLTPEERTSSVLLYESLTFAKDELLKGVTWFEVKDKIYKRFLEEPLARLEYFQLVKTDSLEETKIVSEEESCSICIAAFIGRIRLIDNITVTN